VAPARRSLRRLAPAPLRRVLDAAALLGSPVFDPAYAGSVAGARSRSRGGRGRTPGRLRTAWLLTGQAGRDIPAHPLLEPRWLAARTPLPKDLPLALAYPRRPALRTSAPHPLVDPRTLAANWPGPHPGGPLLAYLAASSRQQQRCPPSGLWNPADGEAAERLRWAWEQLRQPQRGAARPGALPAADPATTVIVTADPADALATAVAADTAGMRAVTLLTCGDPLDADRILLTAARARLADRGDLVVLPTGCDVTSWLRDWAAGQPPAAVLAILIGAPSAHLTEGIADGRRRVASGSDLAEVLEPAVSERADPRWSRALIGPAGRLSGLDSPDHNGATDPVALDSPDRNGATDPARSDPRPAVHAAVDALLTAAAAAGARIAVPGMDPTAAGDPVDPAPEPLPARARTSAGRAADDPPCLRWSIRTAVTSATLRANWGDTWFAVDLAAALGRLGQHVVVDSLASRSRTSLGWEDVTVVLRGKADLRGAVGQLRQPTPVRILWVISNPETVRPAEFDDYDHVAAASPRWAAEMTRHSGRPVLTLLQCTDPHRFRPPAGPLGGDPHVLFIGGARDTGRPAVAAALAAGAPLAVYGHGWEGRLPRAALRNRHLAPSAVPAAYAAAGVVLNDHTEDMRAHGFWSNRLFDAAAAGARVLSDAPPDAAELAELFGGSVRTFTTPAQAAGLLLDPAAAWPPEEVRRQTADRLAREHSFDARAARLLALALGH